jgi:hypothetical protein
MGGGGVGNRGRVFRYENDSTGLPSKFNVARGTGAPNQLLVPRDRCESVGCFIGLQNAPASFGDRRCEPNFILATILAIKRQIKNAGGDALTVRNGGYADCQKVY